MKTLEQRRIDAFKKRMTAAKLATLRKFNGGRIIIKNGKVEKDAIFHSPSKNRTIVP